MSAVRSHPMRAVLALTLGIATLLPCAATAGESPATTGMIQSYLASITANSQLSEEDPNWNLQRIELFEAWKMVLQRNRVPGQDVVIGLPDSGVTYASEASYEGALLPNILMDQGHDFYAGDNDATDDLDKFGFAFPQGHGTGISAMLVSLPGRAPGNTSDKGITGIVPGAKIIPMRVHPSPALFAADAMRGALRRLINKRVDVINISMATAVSDEGIERILQEARQKGIIVVAAAGHYLRRPVLYPASSPNVIAATATSYNDHLWNLSAMGPEVFVAAPGDGVWTNSPNRDENTLELRESHGQGHGTTWAAGTVSGIAALWLSYHGRDNLVARYGEAGLVQAFKEVVQRGGFNRPDYWNPAEEGVGIINARKVLEQPLP